jgi:hypothetical protein
MDSGNLFRGLCAPLCWFGWGVAEDVRTQLVACDFAERRLLDRNASLGWNAGIVAACPPIADDGLANAKFFSQGGDATRMIDRFIERVHRARSSRFVFLPSTLFVLDAAVAPWIIAA